MTSPGLGYDEIGSRTRQAWLRTSLGVVAVTLLTLRGLVVADADVLVLILAVLPATAFLSAAVIRSSRLQRGQSDAIAPRLVAGVVTALGLLTVVGLVGVILGQWG